MSNDREGQHIMTAPVDGETQDTDTVHTTLSSSSEASLTDCNGASASSHSSSSSDLDSCLTDEVSSGEDGDSLVIETSSMDSILQRLGEFGRFQRILYFALWLPAASMAAGVYASVYMEYKPKFYCADDGEGGVHSSYITATGTESQAAQCYSADNTTCTAWVYDTSVFTSTIVTQFNLVCDNSYLTTLSSTFYMLGMLVGSFFFGWFGDRYGRKAAFLASTLFLSVGSIMTALSPWFVMYVVARFITSCGGTGLFITCFVISMEFVGPKFRTVCGVAIEVPFALGELYIVGLAYLIRDWRVYQLVIGVPFLLFLFYLFKIPESVRWLMSVNRRKEARRVLTRVAEFNRVILPDIKDDTEEDNSETADNSGPPALGVFAIFTQPTLRLRFSIIALNWIVTTLGYYGLSLSSASLGHDAFSSFALSAAMELPSYLFCILSLDRFGRKGILTFSQILAGTTCIAAATISLPEQLEYLRTGLTLLGKFGASAGFAVVFVFTAELFPTSMRNSAVGLCSTCARLGGLLSPYISSLSSTDPVLPFLVMGCCCCLGGVAALLLPETSGLPLPDTIDQAVNQGRRPPTTDSKSGQRAMFQQNVETGRRTLSAEDKTLLGQSVPQTSSSIGSV